MRWQGACMPRRRWVLRCRPSAPSLSRWRPSLEAAWLSWGLPPAVAPCLRWVQHLKAKVLQPVVPCRSVQGPSAHYEVQTAACKARKHSCWILTCAPLQNCLEAVVALCLSHAGPSCASNHTSASQPQRQRPREHVCTGPSRCSCTCGCTATQYECCRWSRRRGAAATASTAQQGGHLPRLVAGQCLQHRGLASPATRREAAPAAAAGLLAATHSAAERHSRRPSHCCLSVGAATGGHQQRRRRQSGWQQESRKPQL